VRWISGFSPLFVCLVGATAALAVDGVLEINQACAVNTGCFAGDTAGYPVTITSPGSYRLTGNLVPGGRIEISVDSVTLDLNGNEIGQASPAAIVSTGRDTRVTNGVVGGSGSSSSIVITGIRAHVDNVRTEGSVQVGFGAVVMNSHIYGGSTDSDPAALEAGGGSVVTGNTVRGESNVIVAGSRSVVRNNSITTGTFGSTGISCSSCIIDSNAIFMVNDSNSGIVASESVVRNNVVSGTGLQLELGNGISCSRCTVIGNVVADVKGFGLLDSSGVTGYANNQFDNNNGGNANPQVSGGIEIGTNICGGDTTCP
jgi:hypothetical protein